MLSIASMSGGQDGYYRSLAREDYYLEGGEPPGQWFGKGAEILGLTGKIDGDALSELFRGFHQGRALVQNAGKVNPQTGNQKHTPGWDLTFSAPKSVSVAWSQADPATAAEIRAAHQEAVEKALAYLEETAGFTRREAGGTVAESCDLVFATFEHGTSRAQDPQLHTHALLMNVSVRSDGTTGTVYGRPVFAHKMAAGAIYRTELAYQVGRRLGLQAEADRRSFKLKDVSEKVVEEFSTRRRQMLDKAREIGAKNLSPKLMETLALTSRDHKAHKPRQQLLADWKVIGRKLGWSTEQLNAMISAPQHSEQADREIAAKIAAGKALDTLTQQQSTFTESDLVRAVAEQAQTQGIDAKTVLSESRNFLRKSPEIISLGIDGGTVNRLEIPQSQAHPEAPAMSMLRFTTREIINLESAMLNVVKQQTKKSGVVVSDRAHRRAVGARPTMTAEQAEMVRYLTRDKGLVKVVTGDAGTGKTFALSAVRDAVEAGGYRITGAALSARAANEISNSGIKSRTIAGLFMGMDMGSIKLDSKTMLVIDEAAMVGTRQMAELIGRCARSKTTLVLVGDNKQLQAIEQGGSFQAIAKTVGGRSLTEIFRQKDPAEKAAVQAMGYGDAKKTLRHYQEQKRLTIREQKEQAIEALIRDWQKDGMAEPKENLILCSTNSDVTSVNREIQIRRLYEGRLGQSYVAVGEDRYHKNDCVVFTKNKRSLGVTNGTQGTVVGVSNKLKTMRVKLDSGKTRTIPLLLYSDVRLGYAVTTHKAQGMTASNAYVLTHETMQHRELSYVQASRAKFETRVYTTEAEAGHDLTKLARAMERSREKQLATAQAKKFEHPATAANRAMTLGY